MAAGMSDVTQPEAPRTMIEPWMQEAARRAIASLHSAGALGEQEIAAAIAEASPRFTIATLPDTHVIARVHCPVCQAVLRLKVPENPTPFNSGKVSFIAVVHKPTTCDCGRTFVPFLTGANLQCALAEIQPESPIAVATQMPRGPLPS
jgi:hypothetical protein